MFISQIIKEELDVKYEPKYRALIAKRQISNAQLQYKISVLVEKWTLITQKLQQWEER